jgi:hypothetical protein
MAAEDDYPRAINGSGYARCQRAEIDACVLVKCFIVISTRGRYLMCTHVH